MQEKQQTGCNERDRRTGCYDCVVMVASSAILPESRTSFVSHWIAIRCPTTRRWTTVQWPFHTWGPASRTYEGQSRANLIMTKMPTTTTRTTPSQDQGPLWTDEKQAGMDNRRLTMDDNNDNQIMSCVIITSMDSDSGIWIFFALTVESLLHWSFSTTHFGSPPTMYFPSASCFWFGMWQQSDGRQMVVRRPSDDCKHLKKHKETLAQSTPKGC